MKLLSLIMLFYIKGKYVSKFLITKVLTVLSEWFIWVFSILGFGLFMVAFVMPFKIKEYYEPLIENYETIANLGAVGDFIGGTTVAFLTAASVLLLLATIIMQRKEIKISQQSIEELVKQTAASVEQAEQARKETQITNETMKQQQVESTFFNMLSLHHQIVNSLHLSENNKTLTGRDVFASLKEKYELGFGQTFYFEENSEKGLNSWIGNYRIQREYIEKIFNNVDTIKQEKLDAIYSDFHDVYGNLIGHYMRNNYRIVKFIVNNIASDKKEQKRIKGETGREPIIGDIRYYFGTLRAQWSNAEFELILINALYTKHKKFKYLILKYDVLDIQDKGDTSAKFKLKDSMDRFKAYRSLIENQE